MDASSDVCWADPTETATNQIAVLIKDIHKVMLLCNNAIYRSQVCGRPDGATYTYVRMMDVSSYLHKLFTNDHLRDGVMRHFHMLEKFLSYPACEIIEQLKFNTDLIEVSNGFCFSILQRRFINSPISPSMRGKISPRAYVPYNCSTPPQPGYFRDVILNSFEDIVTRVNFLNKFYHCLLASKMPQKVRKLVVFGPRDSGKTSWANVFHRIVPRECIVSVINESQFSMAMIREDTQLVIVDEWSSQMMTSHLAKTILQGGWMVTAVKHEDQGKFETAVPITPRRTMFPTLETKINTSPDAFRYSPPSPYHRQPQAWTNGYTTMLCTALPRSRKNCWNTTNILRRKSCSTRKRIHRTSP